MDVVDRRCAKGLFYILIFGTMTLAITAIINEHTISSYFAFGIMLIVIFCYPGGCFGKYIWPRRLVKAFNPAKETKCPPGHSVCPECGKVEKIGEETRCH